MTDLWSMMGGCDSVSTVDALLASGCSLDELFDDPHVLLELRSNTRVEDLTARITAHIFLRDNNYAARVSAGCADGCARGGVCVEVVAATAPPLARLFAGGHVDSVVGRSRYREAGQTLRTWGLSYGLLSGRRTLSATRSSAQGGAVSLHGIFGFWCGHLCVAAYSSFPWELVMRCPDVCEVVVVVLLASALLRRSDANVDAVEVLAVQFAVSPGASALGASRVHARNVGALA